MNLSTKLTIEICLIIIDLLENFITYLAPSSKKLLEEI